MNKDNSTNGTSRAELKVYRTRMETRKAYDRLSRWYDFLAGPSEQRLRREGLKLLGAKSGETVLEIGYGTGHAIVSLAESVGTEGHVFGVDISTGMQRVTEKRVNAAGLASRVTLSCHDAAESLPFNSDTFDAIFLTFALELFEILEMQDVLRECRRVLKFTGRLVVVAMYAADDEADNLMQRLYRWAHRRYPRYVDCRPIPLDSFLKSEGWNIRTQQRMSTFGLPVIALLAAKPEDAESNRKER